MSCWTGPLRVGRALARLFNLPWRTKKQWSSRWSESSCSGQREAACRSPPQDRYTRHEVTALRAVGRPAEQPLNRLRLLVEGHLRQSSEASGRKCRRVILLNPLCHFLADEATKIEAFAGVARAHQAANLHGAVREVGDLQTADPLVPEQRRVDILFSCWRRSSTGME